MIGAINFPSVPISPLITVPETFTSCRVNLPVCSGGRVTVWVPVPVRAIANGPVSIRLWLEVKGKQIGEESVIDVSVNYDVELFLLVSLAVAMFSLIVIGVVRTVVKLARSRGE